MLVIYNAVNNEVFASSISNKIYCLFLLIKVFFIILLDTTPPEVNCPQNLTVTTDPEMYFATLNISLPNGTGTYLLVL